MEGHFVLSCCRVNAAKTSVPGRLGTCLCQVDTGLVDKYVLMCSSKNDWLGIRYEVFEPPDMCVVLFYF